MERPVKERWMALAEQAAKEQDPERLISLMTELNRLLEEKEQAAKASANRPMFER